MRVNITKADFRDYFCKVALLAACYYLTGRLGLCVTAISSYAAVWPPAGLALAALLTLGYRYWPGVFFGSFLINLIAPSFLSSGHSQWAAFGVAAVIAGSATLQTLAGTWLVRRIVSFPNPLEQARDIGHLVLFGGPASCIIKATISVATLMAYGAITAKNADFIWLTWWVGDSVGVILFTPVLLLLLTPRLSVSVMRKVIVSITLCITIMIAIYVFFEVRDSEQKNQQLGFSREAEDLQQELDANLQSYIDALYSVGRFYAAANNVSAVEYNAFVAELFTQYPGLHGMAWNQGVPLKQRAAFEERMRGEGFTGFTIKDRNDSGKLITAGTRAQYFPITYAAPQINTSKIEGYDSYFDPQRKKALDIARDSGEATATERTNIILDDKKRYAFLLYMPVFKKHMDTSTVEARRANLLGYTTGAFLFSEVLEEVTAQAEKTRLAFTLCDMSAPENLRLLYDSRTQDHKESQSAPASTDSELQWNKQFEVAGRQWVLNVMPTPSYFPGHQSWASWFVLASGLMFSGLFGIFLLLVTGRTDVVQRLVEEKTKDHSKLIAIIEESTDYIGVADLNGNLQYHNRSATRMVGLPDNYDMSAMKIPDMHPAWAAKIIMKEAIPATYVQGFWQGETALLHRDGHEIPVLQNVALQRDVKGNPICFTTIMRDISQRKASEDALRRSEERLHLATSGTSDGLWDWDIVSGHVYYSPRFMNELGYGENELPQTLDTFARLLHPDDTETTFAAVEASHKHIAPYNVEYRLRHKDGYYLWFNARGQTVSDANNMPIRMTGFTTSIENRKRAEEHREQLVSKLAESNMELERFAYVASHDMQEPLRMIANFGALLGVEYNSKLGTEGQEYIHIVTESAIRMQHMVNDLLEYARIGGESMRFATVNSAEELRQVLENLSAAIQEHNARITYDTLPEIQGNAVQFMRLLQNLIGNGLKYQKEGAAPRVHIGVEDKGDHWEFSVRDNGIGMPEEYLNQIFDPFRRLHTWREFKGTGIGLAVCKKIVENHKGKIWVTSQINAGSTFYFTIPKKPTEEI